MAIFAIGDVHGHLDGLLRLLDKVGYGDSDELWFVGDLGIRPGYCVLYMVCA